MGVEFARQPIGARRGWRTFLAGGVLFVFVGFNHVQGLAIGGIGLLGVLLFSLIERRHANRLRGVLAGLVLLNLAAYLWMIRSGPSLGTEWLNAWGGVNLLSPSSGAFSGAMQILGWAGAANLLIGLILLCRNEVTGWLTVLPFIFLTLPLGGLVFVLYGRATGGDFALFRRLLLGIPPGLALVRFTVLLARGIETKRGSRAIARTESTIRRSWAVGLLVLGLGILVVIPVGQSSYNRLWHLLSKPPSDLTMAQFWRDPYLAKLSRKAATESPLFFSQPGLGFVASTLYVKKTIFQQRWMTNPVVEPPSYRTELLLKMLNSALRSHQSMVLQAPNNRTIFSPYSTAALLSGHWLPTQVALEYAGSAQIAACGEANGARKMTTATADYFEFDER
jgi:hypothetical protein